MTTIRPNLCPILSMKVAMIYTVAAISIVVPVMG